MWIVLKARLVNAVLVNGSQQGPEARDEVGV